MSNPYGITEVDVPGAIGAYEAGQTARVNRLLRRQQAEALERQAERDNDFRNTLARAFGGGESKGGSGAAGAYSSVGDTLGASMAEGSGGIIGTPAPQPAAAQPAPGLTPELAATLVSIDPERGAQIVAAFRTMDTAQAEQIQRANLFLANRAQHLLANVPPEQWAAEIQRMAPELAQHGVNPRAIASFQPTAQSLRGVIQDAMDVERLAQAANPRPMAMEAGGSIVDVNRRDANGNATVIAESPIVMVGGEPYQRPPQMSGRPQPNAPRVVRDRRTGRVLQLNPETNQWEPVEGAATTGSADLDNWNNAGRGGSQGPQTFP